MNIAELTKALLPFVEKAEVDLEEIFQEPVKEYLAAALANPNWFAAIMHTVGSEADEALRLSNSLEDVSMEELAKEVTKKLAGGIVSTTLVPAVLPTPLLNSTNQAILSCLRDRAEEGK
jgi:hypothetical protein